MCECGGDAEADRVMPAYDAFATAAVNVAFPTWFYSAWAIAGLHPLVKAQLSPDQRAAGADPDCRPVAVGECTLRSIARQLTDEASSVAAEELRPQQVHRARLDGVLRDGHARLVLLVAPARTGPFVHARGELARAVKAVQAMVGRGEAAEAAEAMDSCAFEAAVQAVGIGAGAVAR